MRKLELKNQRDKKDRKKQWGVGIVLVGLMILSTLGFAFQGGDSDSKETKVIYRGFEFIYQSGYWFTDTGSFNLALKYNPSQVNLTTFSVNPVESYFNAPFYVFSESNEAEMEIYRNFDPRFNNIVERIQPACIEEKECIGDLPVKTCESNLIIIVEDEEAGITQEEGCVFIRGPLETLTQKTDEFLFKIFRVTQ